MKICILVNDFKKPWAEAGKNNVKAISRKLADNNEIFFIGCSDETTSFDFEGSQVYLFKSWFYNTVPARIFFLQGYINLVFRAAKIIKKEKPDIILSWFETGSTCFFAYLAKLFAHSKAKLIHAVWTDWYSLPEHRPSHFFTEHLPHLVLNNRLTSRIGLYFADEIAATSKYLEGRVKSLGFSNIHFIPGGVDTKKFNPCLSPIIETFEKTTIGYVGHLSHTKGVSLLIEAIWPMLEKEDLRLILAVTDGEEEKIIHKLDHPRITVFNIVDPPAKIYNACDLIIIPRRFSYGTASYPNVVLEAMSCEVPVLCSDLPAMDEIVFENQTGFFFEPNNMNSLRERIKELIKNKKHLRQVGKNARKMVVKNLDWKKIAHKIEKLAKKSA